MERQKYWVFIYLNELDGYTNRLRREEIYTASGYKFGRGGVISGKWRVNMQESKCSGYSGHLRAKFLGNMARPCCNVDWKMWEETEIDHRAYAFNRNNSCTVGDIFSHLCTRNKRVISRNRNSKLSKGQSLGKYDRPLYSSKVYRGRDIRKIEAFCHSWSISLTCTT